MTPISDLLAEAAATGISIRWKEDGKLGIAGGTPELRKAIGTRKHELAACPKCQAVIPLGEIHCVPPASPEVLAESRRAAEDPTYGTLHWVPPVRACHRCGQPAPWKPEASWCTECQQLPMRICTVCSRVNHGVPGTLQQCAFGCGSHDFADRCVNCGKDAIPGSDTCVKCL